MSDALIYQSGESGFVAGFVVELAFHRDHPDGRCRYVGMMATCQLCRCYLGYGYDGGGIEFLRLLRDHAEIHRPPEPAGRPVAAPEAVGMGESALEAHARLWRA